jgi:hypothetical protein
MDDVIIKTNSVCATYADPTVQNGVFDTTIYNNWNDLVALVNAVNDLQTAQNIIANYENVNKKFYTFTSSYVTNSIYLSVGGTTSGVIDLNTPGPYSTIYQNGLATPLCAKLSSGTVTAPGDLKYSVSSGFMNTYDVTKLMFYGDGNQTTGELDIGALRGAISTAFDTYYTSSNIKADLSARYSENIYTNNNNINLML